VQNLASPDANFGIGTLVWDFGQSSFFLPRPTRCRRDENADENRCDADHEVPTQRLIEKDRAKQRCGDRIDRNGYRHARGRRSFQRERPQIERECGAVGPPVSLPHIRCLMECAGKDSLKVSG
jgi:hypothetical protein